MEVRQSRAWEDHHPKGCYQPCPKTNRLSDLATPEGSWNNSETLASELEVSWTKRSNGHNDYGTIGHCK